MIMKRNYFVKHEQINNSTDKGGQAMIIMDIKIDNFYSFKNFHMNMSYPKKIVDSSIAYEYLEERPNFRYKKVNILMGGNATGKTSLGKMLMLFANYCEDEKCDRFFEIINDNSKPAHLVVDFVTNQNTLYRFELCIASKPTEKGKEREVIENIFSTDIGTRDNYELCAGRIDELLCDVVLSIKEIETEGWHFSYPADARKNKYYYSIENNPKYLIVLEQILKTLDPSVEEVIKVKEIENTYAIKINNCSILIQDGKILDAQMLSSGTKAGLDISYIIASLVCNRHALYYCDELFSYVNSDIEKACLSIMIEKLSGRKQLFFTTHNTDILDMQLPKHSFTFLKKDIYDETTSIKCVNAATFLKRNTDSLKHAVENDLFATSPDLDELYKILDL